MTRAIEKKLRYSRKNSESERKKLVDDYEGKLRTSGSTQER